MGTEQVHDTSAKEMLAGKENAAFFFRNIFPGRPSCFEILSSILFIYLWLSQISKTGKSYRFSKIIPR